MHRITSLALAYQPHISRAAALMASVCALCALLYGTLLLEAVAHTAARESAQRQINSLRESLSSLEGEYLTKTQALTLEHAQELGFTAPTSVVTVVASVENPSFSFISR